MPVTLRKHDPQCDLLNEDEWGTVYGPCEAETCDTACQPIGECECWCHNE